jgi:HAD superfamily hydrolase (TIGR01509 family)
MDRQILKTAFGNGETMKISGAIFDLDGTLLDTMSAWETLGSDYLRGRAIQPDDGLDEQLKPMSLDEACDYCRVKYKLPDNVGAIVKGVIALIEHYYFDIFQPKAGVPEFLAQLSGRDIKMCVATANEKYLAEAALLRTGLRGYFGEIYTCTDIGSGKDCPAVFEAALASLDTPKSETVIFEDSLHAIKTAKAAGFTVVGVYDAFEKNQAAVREISDIYIESFTEIPDCLK